MLQPSPRVIIPLTLAFVFIGGLFIGFNYNSGSSVTRVVIRDVFGGGAKGHDSDPNTEEGDISISAPNKRRILVDISAPIPTLPSLTKLVNQTIHEPLSCAAFEIAHNNVATKFVFFIFSHARQVERRKAMRETWGTLVKAECGMRMIFVLGQQEENVETQPKARELQKQLDEESSKFNDILQWGHFIDNGRTPTHKAKVTFEWSLRECSKAEYTVKGEDHVWLNIAEFTKYIRTAPNKNDAIFGHRVYAGSVVFRDPHSYFYVSRDDYLSDTYPEYMVSIMYAFPQAILKTLVEGVSKVHMIPVEDVYWTGLLADGLKIPRNNMEGYEYDYIFDKNRIKCPKKELTAVRYMPPKEMYKYWEDKCFTYDATCAVLNGLPAGP